MQIETDRLELRPFTTCDRERLLYYACENQAYHSPWEPIRPDDYYTLDYWQKRLEIARADAEQSGEETRFLLFLKGQTDGPIIGACNLNNIVRLAFQAGYLGYSLGYRYWGQGYMTEGAQAVVDYGFTLLKLHRIMAGYMPMNGRSGHVLRRLGFVVEGYARDYLKINGRWEDHILTALTNPAG